MKFNNALLTASLVSALIMPSVLVAQVARSVEVEAPDFPAIWKDAGAQKRLLATRAAELDGDRLLIERIYGLEVDANTSVGDLALVNDAISGVVRASLVGALTVGEPDYMPDGRVELVRAVKVKEVVESLNQVIKGKRMSSGAYLKTSEKTEFKRESREKLIEVMGNAALFGSPGHDKVRAKRAAEMDAYRRLAGRMMGVEISSKSTVRDFCLQNDRLVAALSQTLKAAKPTAIKYISDGTCEVTMQVKIADVIRTTKRYVDGKLDKLQVTDEVEHRVFSEAGSGVAPQPGKGASDGARNGKPFAQTEIIIRETIQSTPVVE